MEIKLHAIEPGFVHVRCKGVITRPADEKIEDPLEAVFGTQGWSGTILLDLQEADFIDSGGIAWLMRWHRRATEAGGQLGLCSLSPRVRDVVQLCQMQRLVAIWDNEAAARAQLHNSYTPRPAPESNPRLPHR
jgi:anti-anti-sigma factor